MKNIFAKVRQPALRYGLIFGLILEVIQIVFLGLLSNAVPIMLGQIITIVVLALFVIFGFIAGMKTARATGKWYSGMLAGLCTGAFGFVFFGILAFINDTIFLQQYVNYATTHPAPGADPSIYTSAFVLRGFAFNLLGGLVFYTMIAFVGGLIGGPIGFLTGRNRANVVDGESYEEAMFIPPTPGMD